MNKFIKYILIFSVIAALMLCPFSGCFAIFAEATFGTMWAIAGSAGVSVSSSGLAVGSSEWNDFNDELWGDLDIGGMKYNQSTGTISVDAEDYNAVLDRLADQWGASSTWVPVSLNIPNNPWSSFTTGNGTVIVGYSNGYPATARSTLTSWIYEEDSINITALGPTVSSGDIIHIPSYSVPSSGYYAYFSPWYVYVGNSILKSSGFSGSTITVPSGYTNEQLKITGQVIIRIPHNSGTSLGSRPAVAIANSHFFSDISISSFAAPPESVSAEFSVEPVEIDIDGVPQIVDGAAAITAKKVKHPEDKRVSITPILPNGQKQLQGMPWVDVDKALEQGFLDSVHDTVVSAIGDGVLDPMEEEDTTDLIYGEVSWIRQLMQKIDSTLDSIKSAVLTLVNGNGNSPPPAIMQPPDWLGGGDGGLSFHIGGIWHYVLSWVGSMAAGLALIASVWAGLPSAMTAAIWGSAVVVIVVGLFKRYVA